MNKIKRLLEESGEKAKPNVRGRIAETLADGKNMMMAGGAISLAGLGSGSMDAAYLGGALAFGGLGEAARDSQPGGTSLRERLNFGRTYHGDDEAAKNIDANWESPLSDIGVKAVDGENTEMARNTEGFRTAYQLLQRPEEALDQYIPDRSELSSTTENGNTVVYGNHSNKPVPEETTDLDKGAINFLEDDEVYGVIDGLSYEGDTMVADEAVAFKMKDSPNNPLEGVNTEVYTTEFSGQYEDPDTFYEEVQESLEGAEADFNIMR